MSGPDRPPGAPSGGIVAGLRLLVRFRADGFAYFRGTPQAFANSLAPLLAFPVVGGALLLLAGAPRAAMSDVLVSVIALLAPAVLSHFFARLWDREAFWLRYAVAFNWCQSALTLVMVVLLSAAAALTPGGLAGAPGVVPAAALLLIYWLALYWFLARQGLRLSRLRSTVFLLGINLATGVLLVVPRILAEPG